MTTPPEPAPTAPEPTDDPGHILPDDEWAQVVADAQRHPDNPNSVT